MHLPHSLSMSNSRRGLLRLLGVGLPLLLVLALAGVRLLGLDQAGWSHGFSHPLDGWDHLVTMLAVGIWAAQLRGQAIWMLPLAFVGVMSLGGLAGAAGVTIPSVEGIILLSCGVFAVLISRKIRFSGKVNVLIVAFFAFFHGFAHGQEISTSASLISYTLGFMLATLLLHGAGILVAKLVVLAATCLLTMAFSQAALAKVGSVMLAQDCQTALVGPAFDDARSASHWQLVRQGFDCSSTDSVYGLDALTDAKLAINPSKSGGDVIGFVVFHPDTLVTPGFANALECRFFECLASLTGLSFKHLFPDINQTPGTQLLSNGVGRTSPPLFVRPLFVLAVSKQLRSFPASPITGLCSEPHAESFGTRNYPITNTLSRSVASAVRVNPFFPSLTGSNVGAGARYLFHSPVAANDVKPTSQSGLFAINTTITTITTSAR